MYCFLSDEPAEENAVSKIPAPKFLIKELESAEHTGPANCGIAACRGGLETVRWWSCLIAPVSA